MVLGCDAVVSLQAEEGEQSFSPAYRVAKVHPPEEWERITRIGSTVKVE